MRELSTQFFADMPSPDAFINRDCTISGPSWNNFRILIFPIAFYILWIVVLRRGSLFSKKKEPQGKWLLLLLWIYRVVNALSITSQYHADDYWQSLEVAHFMVFGYGFKSWEWDFNIRSYLHPLPFAAVYKILQLLRLDTTKLFLIAPKVLSGFYAALIDYSTYRLAFRFFGKDVAEWVLFCNSLFWYFWFTMSRFLVNVFECMINLVAMNYWPWTGVPQLKHHTVKLRLSMMLAFIACMMRPTSAALWICLGILELWARPNRLSFIVKDVVLSG